MPIRVLLSLLVASSGCLWIGPADHARRADQDGDGIPVGEDCDDTNPNVAPGRIETPCDGLDNDCNAGTADGPATIRQLTYPDVQSALDAADPGDTVVLCPGTFRESVRARVPVVLTGSAGAADTVIDASDVGGPVIQVEGAGITIRRVTLIGGTGGANPRPDVLPGAVVGGGVLAIGATGDVLLEDVVVHGNTAEAGAGVVGPVEAALRLTRVAVAENVATGDGGGVVMGDGALVDTEIAGNEAGADGGGLWVMPLGAVTAEGSRIYGNAALRGGGAALGASAQLTGAVIEDNYADAEGGGVRAEGASLVDATVSRNTAVAGGGFAGSGTLRDSAFSRNTAERGGGWFVEGDVDADAVSVQNNTAISGDGGGALAVAGRLDLEDSTFSDNEAAAGGGGLAAVGAQVDLLRVDLLDNLAVEGGGALIRAAGCGVGCILNFNAGRLQGNHASGDGGALWVDGDVVDLFTVDVIGNTCDGDGAGGYVGAGGGLTLQSQTLFESNVALGDGGGLAVHSGTDGTLISTSTLRSNGAEGNGGALVIVDGEVTCSSCAITDHQVVGGAAVLLRAEGGSSAVFVAAGATFEDNTQYHLMVGVSQQDQVIGLNNFLCSTDDGGCD